MGISRITRRGLCTLSLLWAAVLGGTVWTAPVSAKPVAANSKELARGKYLIYAGDCVACHTRRGGKPFAGGRPIPTPFGTIYSPNITPDNKTGIGRWSASDFYQALHDGEGKGGTLLYPVFPYPNYTKVTRADVDAMYAYLRSLKPVHNKRPPNQLRFPFNHRTLLLGWRTLYFDRGTYQPDSSKSKQWNRGAYLVDGLGHCSACHSSHNMLGATEQGRRFSGEMIPGQGWYAPDLTSAQETGLGSWSVNEIVDLLKTGKSAHGATFGPMAEVVFNSLQYLNNGDLRAIAVYLKSLPQRSGQEQESSGLTKAERRELFKQGSTVYSNNCAQCHGDDGKGRGGVYPPLAGNAAVTTPIPANPVRMVAQGGFETPTQANPRPYSMPPFADRLSDKQIAAVVTYLRQGWGNTGGAVSPQEVERYRGSGND